MSGRSGKRGRGTGRGRSDQNRGSATARRVAAARAHKRERHRTAYEVPVDVSQLGAAFSVMSYNVLAQSNIDKMRHMYRGRPSYLLTWDYRRSMLLAEISGVAPTILCMQECDAGAYPFFGNGLGKRGYSARFLKRRGAKEDGCAVFWLAKEITCASPPPPGYTMTRLLITRNTPYGLV